MANRSPIPHPGDWPVVHLGEITTKIGSGATPTGGEDSYLPERTRFALVRSQNVFDRHFELTGLAFISDKQANGLQGVVLQPGDLLLNITGDGITFSRACAVPVDVLPACVNQHVAIVRVNRPVADPGYVLSYLTHPAVKSYIESFNAGGSTLCGGASFRFGRAYNVVELDTEQRTGFLHLREMQNDNLHLPIWGRRSLPPNIGSYLQFDFDPPPEPVVRRDANTAALIEAQKFHERAEYRKAICQEKPTSARS